MKPRILLVLLLLLVPADAAAARERAPKPAVVAAFARAVDHYPVAEKVAVDFSIRSEMDRRWSLVTGTYRKRRLWAAWVRRTSSGRYRVRIFRTRDFDPGERVPCDIRPAYSEPAC